MEGKEKLVRRIKKSEEILEESCTHNFLEGWRENDKVFHGISLISKWHLIWVIIGNYEHSTEASSARGEERHLYSKVVWKKFTFNFVVEFMVPNGDSCLVKLWIISFKRKEKRGEKPKTFLVKIFMRRQRVFPLADFLIPTNFHAVFHPL